MNKSHLKFYVSILLISLFAVACSGTVASSWPGLTLTKDMAYVSDASFVYGIKLSDGTLAWKYPAAAASGQSFYAPPLLTPDGSQLLVGDYNKNLYSLDPVNGTMIWTFSVDNGRWIGSPLVFNNLIYAPCSDNNMYVLDLQGNLQWKFNTKAALWAKPVTDGKVIYLASMDHWIYALQPSDGTVIWKTDSGGAMVASPALDSNGILYVGTLANELIAVQSSDGKILWRTTVSGGIWSTPALNDGIMYVGDLSGTIYFISASDGKIQFQQDTTSSITGTPAIIPDGIVFGNEAGTLSALDFNGKSLWPKTFNGKLYTSPAYQTDQIIVAITASSDNLLVSLDTSGNQKWAFLPPK